MIWKLGVTFLREGVALGWKHFFFFVVVVVVGVFSLLSLLLECSLRCWSARPWWAGWLLRFSFLSLFHGYVAFWENMARLYAGNRVVLAPDACMHARRKKHIEIWRQGCEG